MQRILCAFFFFSVLLFGQKPVAQKAPPPPAWGSQTFACKYIDADRVRRLYSSQAFLLEVDRESNLLTARGPQSFLADVEASVKRFDVPPPAPKDLLVTVYVLGLTSASPGSQKLPPEITGPDFKFFSLLDSQTLRIREGGPGDARNLETPSDKLAGLARVRFRAVAVLENAGVQTISFSGLQIDLRLPKAAAESAINADLDVPEKKPVLIGRTGQAKPLVILLKAELTG